MQSSKLSSLLLLINVFGVFESLGIIGGIPASSNYQFFVNIEVNKNHCGGSFISADAVLTAASCLFHREANRYAYAREVRVFKQSYRFATTRVPTSYPCTAFHYHRSYNPRKNDGFGPFDIAVIKLRDCVDLTKPENGFISVCPDNVDYPEGIALGAGLTRGDSASPAQVLMEIQMYRYAPCSQYFRNYRVMVDEKTQICYGGQNRQRTVGTNDGEFGGPLIHKNGLYPGSMCLIGVASFSCSDLTLPTVFTNARFFARLIESSALSTASTSSCNILK